MSAQLSTNFFRYIVRTVTRPDRGNSIVVSVCASILDNAHKDTGRRGGCKSLLDVKMLLLMILLLIGL